jgi:hypothetical protein
VLGSILRSSAFRREVSDVIFTWCAWVHCQTPHPNTGCAVLPSSVAGARRQALLAKRATPGDR